MKQGRLAFSHANLFVCFKAIQRNCHWHLKPAEFLRFCQRGSVHIYMSLFSDLSMVSCFAHLMVSSWSWPHLPVQRAAPSDLCELTGGLSDSLDSGSLRSSKRSAWRYSWNCDAQNIKQTGINLNGLENPSQNTCELQIENLFPWGTEQPGDSLQASFSVMKGTGTEAIFFWQIGLPTTSFTSLLKPWLLISENLGNHYLNSLQIQS